jgi:hypothetical protein
MTMNHFGATLKVIDPSNYPVLRVSTGLVEMNFRIPMQKNENFLMEYYHISA